jgi:hypothetical protein
MILLLIIIVIVSIIIYIYFDRFIYNNFINTNNKIFITFGGGNNNYIEAGERLINQAKSLNVFDETILYTDKYLINDKDFWNKHGNFILKNKRGYGYWLWKPYIIKITMDKMNDGDILLYLDCGCEINKQKKVLMNELFEKVKEYNIIKTTTQIEKVWNKMDLILKMNMNDEKYLNSTTHQAGAIIFYINKLTRNLVNEWYTIACADNYHYIDDTPSIAPNVPEFKEHRHDQSIFSLLCKKYNIKNDINLGKYIEYSRNRTGKSTINN